MGAIGTSVTIAGDGDRAALHSAVWEALRRFIEAFTNSSEYEDVHTYVSEAIGDAESDGGWGVAGDELLWTFKDYAGCCSRSAEVWVHWVELAVAAYWDRLVELAGDHGLTLTGARRELGDLLAGRRRLVVLRDDVWCVSGDEIYNDDTVVSVEELTADERRAYTEATRRCMCALCVRLRPEPGVLAAMLRALDDEASASSVAWYLSYTHAGSADALTAIIRAGGRDVPGFARAVERYTGKVPDAWSVLTTLLPELTGGARGLAFHALAEARRDDADRDVLVDALRAALAGSDAAAEAAAEVAGRVGYGVPDLPATLAAVLDREVSDELRHNAVLGLANLYLGGARVDPAVRGRLERESTRDTEAGRLARWVVGKLLTPAGT